MSIYIPSVDEAALKILKAYRTDNFDQLREIQKFLEDQAVAKRIAGNASEFHNASVRMAQIGFYDNAFALLSIGQQRYSRDTDILADMLLYGLKCRSLEELMPYKEKLDKIKKELWTWRAFHFMFDYLMEVLRYKDSDQEIKQLSDEIESLIADYKKYSKNFQDQSNNEKAYMVEYEYYMFKGDCNNALNALKQATIELPHKSAQCALKLADYFFEKGEYKEVVQYASQAANTKEDQPSISRGYAFYILAMAEEHEIRQTGGALANKVKPIYSDYASAVERMSDETGRDTLLSNIKYQVRKLEFDSGVPSKIDFSGIGKGAELMRLLDSINA